MGKRALITGITGQDDSYLAELLLKKGYDVHGTVRRVALEDPEQRLWRINHLRDRLHLHSASLESLPSIFRVLRNVTRTNAITSRRKALSRTRLKTNFQP